LNAFRSVFPSFSQSQARFQEPPTSFDLLTRSSSIAARSRRQSVSTRVGALMADPLSFPFTSSNLSFLHCCCVCTFAFPFPLFRPSLFAVQLEGEEFLLESSSKAFLPKNSEFFPKLFLLFKLAVLSRSVLSPPPPPFPTPPPACPALTPPTVTSSLDSAKGLRGWVEDESGNVECCFEC